MWSHKFFMKKSIMYIVDYIHSRWSPHCILDIFMFENFRFAYLLLLKTVKIVHTLATAPSLAWSWRVPGKGSTAMNAPELSLTSRPLTFSSCWSMVRNPESVCICTPKEPTVSGGKVVLVYPELTRPLLKQKAAKPIPSARLRIRAMASSWTARAHNCIISLAIIRYARLCYIK